LASFSQHLYGAAAISSAASLGVYGLGGAGPRETQVLFLLGVAGGLLPDIDSDSSKPVRAFFTLLGVLFAFLTCFALVGRFPVIELALIWCLIFLVVRYLVLEVFARLTVHRGIWHSWLAVGFAGLAGTDAAFHLFGLGPWDSWLAGGFVALGYLTHLCLDELASVDLLGHRVRRSFGTALKPFSLASPGASLAMLAAVVVLGLQAPSLKPVLEVARSQGVSVQALAARVLGDSDWSGRLRALFN
jgi:hypothetical protein